MQEDSELVELKELYDELWLDARTMVKDMKKSVYIYMYAGIVTILIGIITLVNALPSFLLVSTGVSNAITWTAAIANPVVFAIEIAFGARLLQWYRKLKKRYAKLIEMDTHWRKPNA